MNKELLLSLGEKVNIAVSILNKENKVSRDYGIGFLLNHAEVNLLYIISTYPNENTSKLALRLGVTKGAIAQITKKLLEKELLTSFNIPKNKKEMYFELTKLGKKAISGHIQHHKQLNKGLQKYTDTLSEKEITTILTFFEELIKSYTVK